MTIYCISGPDLGLGRDIPKARIKVPQNTERSTKKKYSPPKRFKAKGILLAPLL